MNFTYSSKFQVVQNQSTHKQKIPKDGRREKRGRKKGKRPKKDKESVSQDIANLKTIAILIAKAIHPQY